MRVSIHLHKASWERAYCSRYRISLTGFSTHAGTGAVIFTSLLSSIYVIGEEHWLGLKHIFDLTQKKNYRLRIKMKTFSREEKTAFYDNFYLEDNVRLLISALKSAF